MADHPAHGDDDPFADLPPELRAMLEQLGGPDALEQAAAQISSLFSGAGGPMAGLSGMSVQSEGPVDWNLAMQVALQLAADGDRAPSEAERQRADEAFALAEHWLDGTPLPAPPDAGRVVVSSRQEWVNAAIEALKPLVEPVARASTDAMISLAREQIAELGESGIHGMAGMEGLPPQMAQLFEQLFASDPATMLRPAGAAFSGLQAGQVIGALSRQLYGQYDLGIPTAPRSEAHHLAVNVTEGFEGYDLDSAEVAVVLALTEAAHRRLYQAVPWLEAHIGSLVARFAAGTVVDQERLRELTTELTAGIDPEDPEQLREAMERASTFRLEPTDEQRRVLHRLQGVLCLLGAWARREVERAVEGRIPSLQRIEEVLRRRRASRGDGEELLERLLGLDLKPEDESVGEAFIASIEDVLGEEGLHQALAHPENLPSGDELAEPQSWLRRMADDPEVPDDASALFDDLGEAPKEASAEERRAAHGDPGGGTVSGEDGGEDGDDAGGRDHGGANGDEDGTDGGHGDEPSS